MSRILVHCKLGTASALAAGFRRRGIRDIHFAVDASDATERASLAEVVVISHALLEGPLMQALAGSTSLRLLQLTSSGHERLAGLRLRSGAFVATAGEALAPFVAEHALALLFAALLRPTPPCRLRGRTVTVVGTGAVGQEIARQMKPFGVRAIGVSRHGRPVRHFNEVHAAEDLLSALRQSSILILAAPQNALTDKMIGPAALSALTPGAFLVNVGRASLVDTEALAAALRDEKIAAAGLDVIDPTPQKHPFHAMPNVVLTPHYGGAGAEIDVAAHVVKNIAYLDAGQKVHNLIELTAAHEGRSN